MYVTKHLRHKTNTQRHPMYVTKHLKIRDTHKGRLRIRQKPQEYNKQSHTKDMTRQTMDTTKTPQNETNTPKHNRDTRKTIEIMQTHKDTLCM